MGLLPEQRPGPVLQTYPEAVPSLDERQVAEDRAVRLQHNLHQPPPFALSFREGSPPPQVVSQIEHAAIGEGRGVSAHRRHQRDDPSYR